MLPVTEWYLYESFESEILESSNHQQSESEAPCTYNQNTIKLSVTFMPEVELHAVEQSASSSGFRDNVSPDATLISPRTTATVMDTFDKLVLALVIPALVVAAYFNIKACVDGYENPATQVSVINANRTFPGIMICPFSFNANKYFPLPSVRTGLCPQWAPDATLSFTFAPGQNSIRLWHTNSDVASKRQSVSECPNILTAIDPTGGNPYLLFPPFPVPDGVDGYFQRETGLKVTVKNIEKSTLSCEIDFNATKSLKAGGNDKNPCKNPADANTFPYLCPSWTPPQVECLVFDPNHFEEQAKKHGIDPKCNPLKEIKPNSLESVQMSFGNFGTSDSARKTGYAYKGLIPQPNSVNTAFRNLPQNFFLPTYDMRLKNRNTTTDMNISLFNGLTAVIYDASNGIPKELDFSGATTRTMSEQVDSLILFTTECDRITASCGSKPFLPQEVEITTTFEEIYKNQLRTERTTYYNQSVVTSLTNLPRPVGLPNVFINEWSLSVSFSTDQSTYRKQVLSVDIVTTVSVILSIATSIWGARPKIKEAIQVAMAKSKDFLSKRDVAKRAQKPNDPILVFARS
jgi:hypothetical protein